MSELAERLRDVGERHGVMFDDMETIEQAADLVERQAGLLEEAKSYISAIVEGEIPRPLGTSFRQDKAPSRHDRCIHDVPMHGDCPGCIDAFCLASLAKLEAQ